MKKILLAIAVGVVANVACARYIQPDPIGLAGGLNPFVYVNANPLGEIDPEGLQSWRRPNRPGWPAWAQPTNPSDACATPECAAGLSLLRPTPYNNPDFNKDPCVIAYLRENYGNFMADTLLPNFSGFSYVPGSGYAFQAGLSAIASMTTKGAVVGTASGVAVGVQAMGAAGAGVAGGSSSSALLMTGTMASGAATGASILLAAGGVGATAYSSAANAAALLHCSCRR
ncbi:RHS repeat-associated core domain-containing protein [Ramlibacter albus]|uniref:Uncharacterized protein n=1 Tax=Ramlibacter albus TaxID=2079448 RepID=A0A923MCZ1_9BURK|nr:RHS repeat-associated core domain-containing protein [Ramlibacter albus]MBC5766772.1 hypothetical protein [Ramlibacter albus]